MPHGPLPQVLELTSGARGIGGEDELGRHPGHLMAAIVATSLRPPGTRPERRRPGEERTIPRRRSTPRRGGTGRHRRSSPAHITKRKSASKPAHPIARRISHSVPGVIPWPASGYRSRARRYGRQALSPRLPAERHPGVGHCGEAVALDPTLAVHRAVVRPKTPEFPLIDQARTRLGLEPASAGSCKGPRP